MSDFICNICYQNPACKIRQCFCNYCKNCLNKSGNECGCGGSNDFKDISGDIKNCLDLTGNLNESHSKQVIELVNGIKNLIQHQLENSETFMRLKDHQDNMNTKKMFDRIRELENEKQELLSKNQKSGLSFGSEKKVNLNEDASTGRRNFDFSPFEGLWGKMNRY